ncbi:MAG: flagellar hook-length control protein FliK [Pseudomonadota bacterium]
MIPTLLTEAAPTPKTANASGTANEDMAEAEGFATVFADLEAEPTLEEALPDPTAGLVAADVTPETPVEDTETVDPEGVPTTAEPEAEVALPDTAAFAPDVVPARMRATIAQPEADLPRPVPQTQATGIDARTTPPPQKPNTPAAATALTTAPGQTVAEAAVAKDRPLNKRAAPPKDLPAPTPISIQAKAQPTQPAAQPAPAVPAQLNLQPETREQKLPARHRIEGPASPQTTLAAPAPVAPPPAVALAQAMPVAMAEGKDLRPLLTAEPDFAAQILNAERQAATPMTSTAAPPTAGAETARQIASQIGLAISQQPGKPVEIALHPEELGRVRFSLSAGDGVVVMALQAERAETQDLLRRHIDVLAQELRALGYDNLSFSFGSTAQGQADGNEGDTPATNQPVTEETTASVPPQQLITTTGLDLRL